MERAENTRNTATAERVVRTTRPPGRSGGGSLTDTDQDVVKACLARDTDAYATLVERYGGRACNIALRITADADAAKDCAQESFIRAYRALHQYDPALPFGPWLYRITTNASLNYVQRWHAHQTPVEELPETPENFEEGPEATAVRREELAEVVAAMKSFRRHTAPRSPFATCSSFRIARWRTHWAFRSER